jgi:hypothetical protein
MMVMEVLNNAARNGCRTGVLSGSDNTAVQTSVDNALANAGINGYTTTVLVNGNQANANTAATGDAVTVTIGVPAGNISWLPHLMFTSGRTLSSSVVMRRE